MDDSIRKPSGNATAAGIIAALLLVATTAGGAATPPSLEQAFTWSADAVNSDLRNDTLDISGNVRVKQGPNSIEAQTARKRNVDANTERWTFEEAVHIRTAEADLQSNLASAAVINGQIASARVEGAPARFQQISGTNNRQVRGRAGVIEYDFNTGVVTLSNQVWFSNGKDEFRGDVVIYNVRDQRVQINPGGSSNRVRGIIRPNQSKTQSDSGGTTGNRAVVEPAFDQHDAAGPEQRAVPKLASKRGGDA
jgi:lipopolysaccharide transport protein LptA